MKRILYSFFLVALLSCGSSPSSSNYHIKIEFRDSVINDYYLLAVRDSSLVITPYTTDYESIDSLNAKAEVVSFTKIGALYKTSSASLVDELWFGGTGLVMGGCFEGIAVSGCGGSGDGGPRKYEFGFPLETTAIGLALGILVNNSYQEMFLDTQENLAKVRSRACYKEDEPPELQKLR